MTLRACFQLGLALFGATLSCQAVTAPGIIPAADTFVGATNPGSNYGAAGAIDVSAPGSANGEYDAFLRFNLAGTKTVFDGQFGAGNWAVQSVTIQLTSSAPNNAIFNANTAGMFTIALATPTNWTEGSGAPMAPDTAASSLNYSNSATYLATQHALGLFNFAGGTPPASAIYTLTLSPGLLSAVQTGGDASLYVAAAAGSTTSYLFNSKSFGTAASRPTLVVDAIAVPEPSVGLLLLLGGACVLAVVVCQRRRIITV